MHVRTLRQGYMYTVHVDQASNLTIMMLYVYSGVAQQSTNVVMSNTYDNYVFALLKQKIANKERALGSVVTVFMQYYQC